MAAMVVMVEKLRGRTIIAVVVVAAVTAAMAVAETSLAVVAVVAAWLLVVMVVMAIIAEAVERVFHGLAQATTRQEVMAAHMVAVVELLQELWEQVELMAVKVAHMFNLLHPFQALTPLLLT